MHCLSGPAAYRIGRQTLIDAQIDEQFSNSTVYARHDEYYKAEPLLGAAPHRLGESSMSNLAALYRNQGQFGKAESMIVGVLVPPFDEHTGRSLC